MFIVVVGGGDRRKWDDDVALTLFLYDDVAFLFYNIYVCKKEG